MDDALQDYLLSFDPPELEWPDRFPYAAIERGYVLNSDWWDRRSIYTNPDIPKYPLQPNPIRKEQR